MSGRVLAVVILATVAALCAWVADCLNAISRACRQPTT